MQESAALIYLDNAAAAFVTSHKFHIAVLDFIILYKTNSTLESKSMKILKFLFSLGLSLIAGQSFATTWQENQEMAELLASFNITGTFVVYDVSADQMIGYNQERADTRYVPASTFKIPNSLIALATDTVKNTREILPYGGGTYSRKVWEQDMSLTDAMKVSNVPVFQGVARNIGMKNMQSYIQKFQYGNMELGAAVDTFWLRGPLKISAVEQTLFLAKLAQGTLPVDAQPQAVVKEITLMEKGDHWALHAKTGWYEQAMYENKDKDIGWWVGWIEKDGRIYAFALNTDIDSQSNAKDLENRVLIGKACLRILGLYP